LNNGIKEVADMKLNERLKLARKQKGFTQQEIADILHISRATVSSWEVGRTLPSLDFIIDLSDLYDLSLDILLKEDMIMVNQVNKELKTKKVYKGIVVAIGSILLIFAIINAIWLFNVKNQYSYIGNNWEKEKKYYLHETGDIFMRSPQLSVKDEFKFHYLDKQPLWIMAFKGDKKEKDYLPSVTIWDNNNVFADVPINKNKDVYMSVRIDKNALLVEDDRNPDFLFINSTGEDAKFVNKFLEENNKIFKELYSSVDEQFKLINKIKTP